MHHGPGRRQVLGSLHQNPAQQVPAVGAQAYQVHILGHRPAPVRPHDPQGLGLATGGAATGMLHFGVEIGPGQHVIAIAGIRRLHAHRPLAQIQPSSEIQGAAVGAAAGV